MRSLGSSTRSAVIVLGLAATQMAGGAAAQNYPSKNIRIITTPVASGGDVVARELAAGMSGPLGTSLIVENRPALVAIEIAAKSSSDGYTLLVNGSVIWTQPLLRKRTPWHPVRDFTPITLAARSPNVLVVSPSVPAKSVTELIALAKAKPGLLSYVSAGSGSTSQLAAELFKSMAGGLNILGVAYKGAGPGIVDLMAGRVQIGFIVAASVIGQVKSGKLRALAVTSKQRTALAEGLPTISESGLPGYETVLMLGVYAPAKTPRAIISRLNQEMVKVLNDPATKQRLLVAGADAVGSTPEELLAAGKEDMARWSKVIKEAGLQVD